MACSTTDNLVDHVNYVLASLAREVRFFRTVYQATEEMQDRIRSVEQELTLNYYVRPKEAGEAHSA